MTPPDAVRPGRSRRVRGAVTGAVASFGALVAHGAAGGEVGVLPALVVLSLTVPLAIALTRLDSVDLLALGFLAGVAQTVGHVSLLVVPGASHSHGNHDHATSELLGLVTMLGTHGAVALATVALAAGYERALLDVVRSLLGWLLPSLPERPVVPVRARVAVPVVHVPLTGRVASRPSRPRGPPARASYLALTGVAR